MLVRSEIGEGVSPCEIVVPRVWQALQPADRTNRGFASVTYLRAPGDQNTEIHISLLRHEREVNPGDCLELVWSQSNDEILERRSSITGMGVIAELLVRHIDDRGRRICRSRVIKDGQWMFRVDAQASEAVYDAVAHDLLLALSSFRLLEPQGKLTAEALIEKNCSLPVPYRFQYPEAWGLSQWMAAEHGSSFLISNVHRSAEVGRISVEVWKRTPDDDLIVLAKRHSEHWRQCGIRFGGAAILPVEPPGGFQAALIYHPKAELEERQLDAPLLLLQGRNACVALSLLGPARNESPQWWAINKRAFEIVRDSLRMGAAADEIPNASPLAE